MTTLQSVLNKLMDVIEFVNAIKTRLNRVQNIKVKGELGKITRAASGHFYFELIGNGARLNCVAWASSELQPCPGVAEIVVRNVDYYAPSARCQAIVSDIKPLEQEAAVAAEQARIIDTLAKKDLMYRQRLDIPEIVRHVCVITSNESAAYYDMIEGITQRWPGLRTSVIHSSVQGERAVADIKQAFQTAYAMRPDVIICGRGGGSGADLAVFNNEEVIMCFVNDTVPVISAIGHESDHCLCDLVADARAKTPTASIDICIPRTLASRMDEIRTLHACAEESVSSKLSRFQFSLSEHRETLRVAVANACVQHRKELAHEYSVVKHRMQRTHVESANRLVHARKSLMAACQNGLNRVNHAIAHQRCLLIHVTRQKLLYFSHKCSMVKADVRARSIEANLSNGFCVLLDSNGRAIRNTNTVKTGDQLCVMLTDAKIEVIVKNVRKRKHQILCAADEGSARRDT